MDGRIEHAVYTQVADHLRELVEKGELSGSEQLPVIDDLRARFGCCRRTAARGLWVLKAEGIAQRIPGHGWFVA